MKKTSTNRCRKLEGKEVWRSEIAGNDLGGKPRKEDLNYGHKMNVKGTAKLGCSLRYSLVMRREWSKGMRLRMAHSSQLEVAMSLRVSRSGMRLLAIHVPHNAAEREE